MANERDELEDSAIRRLEQLEGVIHDMEVA